MSITPRTDAAVIASGFQAVPYEFQDFARQLETELAAARVEVERLRKRNELLTDHYECKMNIPERVSNIETKLAAMKARAEKAEVDTARLDWLRKGRVVWDGGTKPYAYMLYSFGAKGSTVRAAIDAAMKEARSGK